MRKHIKHACLFTVFVVSAAVARAQGPLHVAVFVYRMTNSGKIGAASATAHCILPTTSRYHGVTDLRIDPEPSREYVDAENQRVIAVPLGSIPPGQTRAVRVLAWVRLKKVDVPLAATDREVEPLSPEREQAYLKDSSLLQLEKVRPIARQTVADETRDLDQARALYAYMAENCRYDIDSEVDAARSVLDGKPASCSELACTYVALCRSLHIPARVVSAFVNRQGTSPSVDWRSHRWAEFYAEGIGWVPVDPTHKINRPSDDFFGQQEAKYLTVLDDGVVSLSGPDPGWRTFLVYVEPANAQFDLTRSAAWRLSGNPHKETEFFKQAGHALRDPDPAQRRLAVGQWNRARSPLAVAFLLEALFDADAEVRRIAATAIGRSGDSSVLLPLMKRAETELDINVLHALLDTAGRLLDTPDGERKARAVSDLARSRTDQALKLLDGIWADEARPARKAAAQMLYKFGDKTAVHEAYRRLVDDEDEFIRVVAALRWARVGSHEALERLVEHLESTNPWDREQALAELEKRTRDSFNFNPDLGPKARRNRDAIQKFRDWLNDHPEAR